MIKYFCDRCEKELPEPYCLYTTGWILCGKCLPKFQEENRVGNIIVLPVRKNKPEQEKEGVE